MNNKIFYGIVASGIAVIIVLIVLKFIFRKQGKLSKEERVTKLLYQLSYYAVSLVEAIYHNGNGKKKLDEATRIIRNKLPDGVSDLVSDEMIHRYIENALSTLQIAFKAKKVDTYNILDKVISVGANTQDVKAVIETARNLRDNKAYLEGYGEVRSDLHGKTEAVIGARGGVKL